MFGRQERATVRLTKRSAHVSGLQSPKCSRTIAAIVRREREGLIAWDDFAILPAALGELPTRHLHVGFGAPSRAAVDAFWRAGVETGYLDAGRPGEHEYTSDYYGAFLLDSGRNSVEAVHHHDVRRGAA